MTTEPVVSTDDANASQPEVPSSTLPDSASSASPEVASAALASPEVPSSASPEVPSSELPEVPSSALPELNIGGSDAIATVDPTYQPVIRGKIDRFGVAMGTGRRKTSVARVRIKEGSGAFVVNGRALEEYLCVERDRDSVMFPLRVADKVGKVDISIRVQGGGTTGQTGAIILGIARALEGMNPAWHHALADAGLLTRDDRMVERKKYGLRKARRSFQFSKR